MRGKAVVVAMVGAAGVAAVVASGTASALEVDPQPGALTVTLNQGEAGVVSGMNLGPAIGQVAVPAWSPLGKQVVGQEIGAHAGAAAAIPGSYLRVTLYGPLQYPEKVTVGHWEPTR